MTDETNALITKFESIKKDLIKRRDELDEHLNEVSLLIRSLSAYKSSK